MDFTRDAKHFSDGMMPSKKWRPWWVITCSEREDHRSTDGHKLPAFSQGLQKDILQDAPGETGTHGGNHEFPCLEKDIMGVSINAGSPKCLVYNGKSNKTTPIDVFMLCYVCNSMQSAYVCLPGCLSVCPYASMDACMHVRIKYGTMYLCIYPSMYLSI